MADEKDDLSGATLPAALLPGLEPSGLYRPPAGEGRLGEGASEDAPSPLDALHAESRIEGDSRPDTEIVLEKREEAGLDDFNPLHD